MVVFLVLAYNEEQNIGPTLDDIGRRMKEMDRDFRICLIDDGSRDGTVEKARARSLPLRA